MPRFEKAKKQESCRAPTDRTIGQSVRGGQTRRPRQASSAKATVADSVARAAANHSGVEASRPILMIGQLRPNRMIFATSCSQAMRGMGLSLMVHVDRAQDARSNDYAR